MTSRRNKHKLTIYGHGQSNIVNGESDRNDTKSLLPSPDSTQQFPRLVSQFGRALHTWLNPQIGKQPTEQSHAGSVSDNQCTIFPH